MKITVIANETLKERWLAHGLSGNAMVQWCNEIEAATVADCYIDLLFDGSQERLKQLLKLLPAFIIVNEVTKPLTEFPGIQARFNGWPGSLEKSLLEVCCAEDQLNSVEELFAMFNRSVQIVPDQPGLVTPRVISMIINEAYLTLDEKVSSKQEIDIAMKLGTNYPYGPFEWSEKIGLEKIYGLLNTLSKHNSRYTPSSLLEKEASHS